MKNFERLEVGKSYRNRLGETVLIVDEDNRVRYPFNDSNGDNYTASGVYNSNLHPNNYDLVELITISEKHEGQPTVGPPSAAMSVGVAEEMGQTKIRRFPSGAIRSDNTGRERFDWISPLALKALAEYLSTTENSFAQVNYFKGIPEDACVESVLRHINDFQINRHKKEAVALLFNAVALVHTICLRERGEYKEAYPKTEIINKSDYKEE